MSGFSSFSDCDSTAWVCESASLWVFIHDLYDRMTERQPHCSNKRNDWSCLRLVGSFWDRSSFRCWVGAGESTCTAIAHTALRIFPQIGLLGFVPMWMLCAVHCSLYAALHVSCVGFLSCMLCSTSSYSTGHHPTSSYRTGYPTGHLLLCRIGSCIHQRCPVFLHTSVWKLFCFAPRVFHKQVWDTLYPTREGKTSLAPPLEPLHAELSPSWSTAQGTLGIE